MEYPEPNNHEERHSIPVPKTFVMHSSQVSIVCVCVCVCQLWMYNPYIRAAI